MNDDALRVLILHSQLSILNLKRAFRLFSSFRYGKCDKQVRIVVGGGFASYVFFAFFTFIFDHETFFRVGTGGDGDKQSAAFVCAVAGIYIDVF